MLCSNCISNIIIICYPDHHNSMDISFMHKHPSFFSRASYHMYNCNNSQLKKGIFCQIVPLSFLQTQRCIDFDGTLSRKTSKKNTTHLVICNATSRHEAGKLIEMVVKCALSLQKLIQRIILIVTVMA